MKTLLINVKPFTFSQNVSVFEEGKEIECTAVPMNVLEDSIVLLAYKHNTTDVNIAGPKLYTKGIQKKIQKAEFNKYSKNSLNIKLV